MIARLLFVGLLLLAPSAAAQETSARPPATAEQIATARGEADRIIAAGSAGDVFENVTADQTPRVKHTASGMICSFFGSQEIDRILIFPDPTRGDDVGCTTRDTSGSELTFYATRYKPMPTEQEVLETAVGSIRDRFPSARPYEGELASVSVSDTAAPIGAAMTISTTLGEMFTLALVSHQGEWGFKARATGPLDQADEVNLLAQSGFLLMLTLRGLEADGT